MQQQQTQPPARTCPVCGGEGFEDGEDAWGYRLHAECLICEGSGTVPQDAFEALTREVAQ